MCVYVYDEEEKEKNCGGEVCIRMRLFSLQDVFHSLSVMRVLYNSRENKLRLHILSLLD